jgi:hypothetical protein
LASQQTRTSDDRLSDATTESKIILARKEHWLAAEAVAAVAIFPRFSGEHRLWGFTDFNDLASEEPRLVTRQVEEVLQGLREKSQAPTQGIELAGAA